MATIDIVAACDDRYAQHAYVMIQSVVESNHQHLFRFHLLVPQEFSSASRMLQAERSGRCEVRILRVPPGQRLGPLSGHIISEVAYYRLLPGHLLPQDIHRVIYLDCDIVVRGDLKPLWDTDLQGFVIAAVEDAGLNNDVQFKARLGLREDAVYFNSGMMLIDLKKWRQEEVGEKVLDICARQPELLEYHDQCALNAYFNGRVCPLDGRWNKQSSLFSFDANDAAELAKPVVIVHFTLTKPWLYACCHPLASLYRDTLENTPWRDYVPADRTMLKVIKRRLKGHLKPVLPIMKRARDTLQAFSS